MNPYKLSFEEVKKAAQDFNKTGFGRRAYIYSLLPIFTFFVLFIIFTHK